MESIGTQLAFGSQAFFCLDPAGAAIMLVLTSVTFVNASNRGAARFIQEMNAFGWHQHDRIENLFVARFPARADVDEVAQTVLSDVSMCYGVTEAAMFHCRVTIMVDADAQKLRHSDR